MAIEIASPLLITQVNLPKPVKDKTISNKDCSGDREVIRCHACGLVQYQTRTGNCRRCLRLLPPSKIFILPTLPPEDPPRNELPRSREHSPNSDAVENLGRRIRNMREAIGISQGQFRVRAQISRPYLSKIENGYATPTLGALEKIAEALGIGLNRLFIGDQDNEAVLEDPFVQNVRPFLRQLNCIQRQDILKCLRAIGENNAVHSRATLPRPTPQRFCRPRSTPLSKILPKLQAELRENMPLT